MLGPEHGTDCNQRIRNAPTCDCLSKPKRSVALVTYENGKRRIIGRAKVRLMGNAVKVEAEITDDSYRLHFEQLSYISLGRSIGFRPKAE